MADDSRRSDAPVSRACGRCGASFACGMEPGNGAAGSAPCWCAALPNVLPVPRDGGSGCVCPACLGEMLKTRTAASPAAPPEAAARG